MKCKSYSLEFINSSSYAVCKKYHNQVILISTVQLCYLVLYTLPHVSIHLIGMLPWLLGKPNGDWL